MNKRSRFLIITAALLLMAVYFVPVWRITLQAPQYPEGLGLFIWMTDIRGVNPHDLQKINELNHYIGMKPIEPRSIPELVIMPLLLGALCTLGVLTAITGKRKLLWLWLIAMAVFAIAGLCDFYVWGYDYGHSLNPSAPIRIPGMSYQPPVLGTKKLLNFTASSLPWSGAVLAALSFGFGMWALSTKTIFNRRRHQ